MAELSHIKLNQVWVNILASYHKHKLVHKTIYYSTQKKLPVQSSELHLLCYILHFHAKGFHYDTQQHLQHSTQDLHVLLMQMWPHYIILQALIQVMVYETQKHKASHPTSGDKRAAFLICRSLAVHTDCVQSKMLMISCKLIRPNTHKMCFSSIQTYKKLWSHRLCVLRKTCWTVQKCLQIFAEYIYGSNTPSSHKNHCGLLNIL